MHVKIKGKYKRGNSSNYDTPIECYLIPSHIYLEKIQDQAFYAKIQQSPDESLVLKLEKNEFYRLVGILSSPDNDERPVEKHDVENNIAELELE